MKLRHIAIALIYCTYAYGAPPTPFPLTNEVRASKAPALEVFRANDRTFRHYIRDGASVVNISNTTVTASFFRQLRSTNVISGTIALVNNGTNGIVDVTYSAANLNQTPRKYLYALTLTDSGGSIVTVQQGDFVIRPSPATTGVSTSSFGEVFNAGIFTQYVGLVTGPYRAGTGVTFSANSDGSQDIDVTADNVNASFTSTNYSTSGDSISEHLLGIDAEFVNAQNAANLTNRIEYMSFVIFPTNAIYHITWAMPLRVPITLRKIFAFTDASTCTVDIVEGASNAVWTAFGTNNAAIVANTNEVWDTSFADAAIPAGSRVGVKVVNFNSSCKNATIGIEYRR